MRQNKYIIKLLKLKKSEVKLKNGKHILKSNGNQIIVSNQRILKPDDVQVVSFEEMKNRYILNPSL